MSGPHRVFRLEDQPALKHARLRKWGARSLLVSELRGRRAVRIRTHAQPAGVDDCGEFLGRRIAGLHFEHLVRDLQAGAVEIEFAPEFHRGLRIVVGL